MDRRGFDVLGFDEYIESYADGLQILRYNTSKAYNRHLDWIDDELDILEHDYDSSGRGGNRFATILLYMTDMEEGGETVFTEAWPDEANRVPLDEVCTDEFLFGWLDQFRLACCLVLTCILCLW